MGKPGLLGLVPRPSLPG